MVLETGANNDRLISSKTGKFRNSNYAANKVTTRRFRRRRGNYSGHHDILCTLQGNGKHDGSFERHTHIYAGFNSRNAVSCSVSIFRYRAFSLDGDVIGERTNLKRKNSKDTPSRCRPSGSFTPNAVLMYTYTHIREHGTTIQLHFDRVHYLPPFE